MKPIIYEADTKSFTNHGLGAVSPLECIVTEELNGVYELEMTVSENDIRYSELIVDRIILAQPYENASAQPFRIYRITQPMNGKVNVYAEHVSYQLNHIPVMPFIASGAEDAIAKLKSKSAEDNPFTFETNIESTKQFKVDKPELLKNLMLGDDNSLLSVYGYGEFMYDKFKVKFLKSRGEDRKVTIRYGKNMMDFQQETNIQNMVTGICPYWMQTETDNLIKNRGTTRTYNGVTFEKSIDGSVTANGTAESDITCYYTNIKLQPGEYKLSGCPSGGGASTYSLRITEPTEYIDTGSGVTFTVTSVSTMKVRILMSSGYEAEDLTFTPTISLTSDIVTLDEKVVHPSEIEDAFYRTAVVDFSSQFDEKPTQAELKKAAEEYIAANGVGVPEVSITVEFAPLWQSENYKDIAPLEEVVLGDTVTVEFPKLNISTKSKIVRTEFDVLKNRYRSVTVGKVRMDLPRTLTSETQTITKTIAKTSSDLKKDSKRKIEKVSGNNGGGIRINPYANGTTKELLLLDSEDIETAQEILRFNKYGISHSSTGYNGEWHVVLPIAANYLKNSSEEYALFPTNLPYNATIRSLSDRITALEQAQQTNPTT